MPNDWSTGTNPHPRSRLLPNRADPCTGMHHKAALEMCGNTTDAAKRNEQQADLATVSVTVIQHIFRDILNGGIFACRSPREVVIHPTEDTFGFQVGVGFTCCQFGSKFAQARGKRRYASHARQYIPYKGRSSYHRAARLPASDYAIRRWR